MEIIRSIIVIFTILFFASSGISSTSSILPAQQLIHTILRSNANSNKTFELRKFEKELQSDPKKTLESLEDLRPSEYPSNYRIKIKNNSIVYTNLSENKEILKNLGTSKNYVSFAPSYFNIKNDTHYYYPNSSVGELPDKKFYVTLADKTLKKTIYSGYVKTFNNGFFHMWVKKNHKYVMVITSKENNNKYQSTVIFNTMKNAKNSYKTILKKVV